jgi:hypothetical protein
MGYQFSLQHLNYVAALLDPSRPFPLSNGAAGSNGFESFADSLENGLVFSDEQSQFAQRIRRQLVSLRRNRDRRSANALRAAFRGLSWVAVLLPDGRSPEVDRPLCDQGYLRDLIRTEPTSAGLVLQLTKPVPDAQTLVSIAPGMEMAVSRRTRWPGICVWTPHRESLFVELGTRFRAADERIRTILRILSNMPIRVDLSALDDMLDQRFDRTESPSLLKIVHMSDLHLGLPIARRRVGRLKDYLSSLIEELAEDGATVLPIFTGDMVDSASQEFGVDFASFRADVLRMGSEPPIFLVGNHDVRKSGLFEARYVDALRISQASAVCLPRSNAIVGVFNSCLAGDLARGKIIEQEFIDVGSGIDALKRQHSLQDPVIISTLHHHPVKIEHPKWLNVPLFERIFNRGGWAADALENAHEFMAWNQSRGVRAILHGHKHIPNFTVASQRGKSIAVIGCGSSTGIVEVDPDHGTTHMSVNVVTVDPANRRLSCELRAERIPSSMFRVEETHVMLFAD